MRIKIFTLGLVVAAATVSAIGPAQAEVSQTPVVTACPAGYPVMSVTAMEATGPYFLPRLIDTGGNNNGVVCANRSQTACATRTAGRAARLPASFSSSGCRTTCSRTTTVLR